MGLTHLSLLYTVVFSAFPIGLDSSTEVEKINFSWGDVYLRPTSRHDH